MKSMKVYAYAVTIAAVLMMLLNVLLNNKIRASEEYLQQYKEMFVDQIDYERLIYSIYEIENRWVKDIRCTRDDNTKTTLQQEFGNRDSVLVYYFHPQDCHECIETLFEKLQTVTAKANIYVISDFQTFTRIRVLQKKYGLEDVVFLRIDMMESPTESFHPQLFILHRGRIGLYYEHTDDSELLDTYISAVNTYFSNDF